MSLLRVFTLDHGALTVQASAGSLGSRHRVQTHAVEQLRRLLVMSSGPVLVSSRTQVCRFNVGHKMSLRLRPCLAKRAVYLRSGLDSLRLASRGRWTRVFSPCTRLPSCSRVNQQTVRNWIDRGELAAVRAGRRVRIRKSELDRFLEDGSAQSRPAERFAVLVGPFESQAAAEAWRDKHAVDVPDAHAERSLSSPVRRFGVEFSERPPSYRPAC